MGICASCLGLSSNDAEVEEPEETSPLLSHHEHVDSYGTSDQSAQPQIADVTALLEEDQEAAEQIRLTSCWKNTSDKLIDISSAFFRQDLSSKDKSQNSQQDSAYATRNSIDYERLFRDTLPRKPQPGARPSIQADTFTPPITPNGEVKEPINDQQWLRDIIARDPNDKSWDPNLVNKIGRPLLVNFDDVLAKDENGRPSK